jgi:hypothetical protein
MGVDIGSLFLDLDCFVVSSWGLVSYIVVA